MGIKSYLISDETQNIFDHVSQRLLKGPCDSQTLAQELKVDIDFLNGLLWSAGSSANIDFDPTKSNSDNIMWEYYHG